MLTTPLGRVVSIAPLILAACVGTIDDRGGPSTLGVDGGAEVDAGAAPAVDGGGGGGGGAADAGGPDARACDDPNVTGNSGAHKAGQACMSGCHTATTNGPTFTIGGTLYTDLAGSAAIEGAVIHVIDADGNDIALSTAANGNFWTAQPVAFPLSAYATRCPDLTEKVASVSQAQDGGNCNRSGCHTAGMRIHLP